MVGMARDEFNAELMKRGAGGHSLHRGRSQTRVRDYPASPGDGVLEKRRVTALVVSDTSPIRALAHLGRLDVLASLFDEVLIPPAVARELEFPRSGNPIDPAAISHVTITERPKPESFQGIPGIWMREKLRRLLSRWSEEYQQF